jgi:5-methylcytosine-specific restriction endonuclease McrA
MKQKMKSDIIKCMRVLVLNMDYTPINVTDLFRGFNLVFKGKAEIIEHHEKNPIITPKTTYKRPSVIRLLRYVFLPYKKLKPSRDNIYKRDEFRCLYCQINTHLTIDHVIPKSRGGKNTWENLATCCFKCNSKKGDRTPKEANMDLVYKPFKPKYTYFIKKMIKNHNDWVEYIPD